MRRLFAAAVAGLFAIAIFFLFHSTPARYSGSSAAEAQGQQILPVTASNAANPTATPAVAAMPQVGVTSAVSPANPASTTPPPPRKRAWDPQFLSGLNNAAVGDSIRFELVQGEWASGTIE